MDEAGIRCALKGGWGLLLSFLLAHCEVDSFDPPQAIF